MKTKQSMLKNNDKTGSDSIDSLDLESSNEKHDKEKQLQDQKFPIVSYSQGMKSVINQFQETKNPV